jgi:Family of unknown function (DUF5709)
MPERNQHESQNLSDYQVDDAYDTLDGEPGEDPLDSGVIPPERWSAGVRHGTTADEQYAGESLDDLLAEEEPDTTLDELEEAELEDDEETAEDDDDAGDEDIDGLLLDDGPDPRAGRLVGFDGGHHPRRQADLLAHDVGVDGGAASAEEAAVHVVDDDDDDVRPEG